MDALLQLFRKALLPATNGIMLRVVYVCLSVCLGACERSVNGAENGAKQAESRVERSG